MDAKSSRLGLYCVADDILAPKIAISWPVPELVDGKEPDHTLFLSSLSPLNGTDSRKQTGTNGVKMLCTENREILAGLCSPRQDNPLYLCESCPERVFYIQIAGIKQDRILRFDQGGCGSGLVPGIALLNIG